MSVQISNGVLVSYNGAAGLVSGSIGRVTNTGFNYTTGTLRVETWVSSDWFSDPGFLGYRTSEVDFRAIIPSDDGRLNSGEYYFGITWQDQWTNIPPPNFYNIFLVITEFTGGFRNDGFSTADWEHVGYLAVAPFGVFGFAAQTATGTNGIDWLAGTLGNDLITGFAGNDVLFGGTGNDAIHGGAGLDVAYFFGPRSGYAVTASGGTYTVTALGSNSDGVDRLTGVEQLRFSDGTVWVEQAAGLTGIVHRFFNMNTGVHFFTSSQSEANSVRSALPQFDHEGLSFRTASPSSFGATDVFRFYNTQNGFHFYTTSAAERNQILSTLPQFNFEGTGFLAYGSDRGPQEELYRFFNTRTGAHFFTTSEAERDSIIGSLPQFRYEGIAFYVDVL